MQLHAPLTATIRHCFNVIDAALRKYDTSNGRLCMSRNLRLLDSPPANLLLSGVDEDVQSGEERFKVERGGEESDVVERTLNIN